MEKKTIERSIWLDTPREQVWQAVTDPDQLAQWLLPPMLGAQMKRNQAGYLFVCMGEMEVPAAIFEALDPPRQVIIRGLPDRLVAVTISLAEEKNGTQVTVTMSGFELLAEAAYRERLGSSGPGWEKALANLKAYVAGTELPFPEGYVAALFGYRREAEANYAVERSIWIDAQRERVWRALTDPQQIPQWYSPGTAWRLSASEVGGQLSVVDAETDADKYIQIIEEFDPPQRLVLRAVPEPPDMFYDVTSYTLIEENGGTRLILLNSGYDQDAADIRHQKLEQNAFGFGMALENLQAFIDGETLPYPWGF